MSMTKKFARDFKARLDQGEFPNLPTDFLRVLRMQPKQIAEAIRHAQFWEYGNGPQYHARRLVQMGLFDKDWNLTNYGDGYVNAMENVDPKHK